MQYLGYNLCLTLTSSGDHRNILKVYVAGRESLTRPPKKGALETLFLVQFNVHFTHP